MKCPICGIEHTKEGKQFLATQRKAVRKVFGRQEVSGGSVNGEGAAYRVSDEISPSPSRELAQKQKKGEEK